MVKVGIDTLAIYIPRYALDLAALAKARDVDPDKYSVGLGQLYMSVPPPGEDIVTMAVNAAEQVLSCTDRNQIEMVLFATESGIDQSKAASLYVHELLKLPSRCRTLELKQACYSGTAAIQLSLPYLRENPDKKVLVIASDIARYGLHTAGESSQGAGAIAMILSANPRMLALEPEYGVISESVMDFWRPNYCHEALVDGKYSSKLYLTMLDKCFAQYTALSGRHFRDHSYFCYHTPVPRLVEKAHQHLIKLYAPDRLADGIDAQSAQSTCHALHYARQIGNTYTASLYISLASLFDSVQEEMVDKRIGFYSYGSGCVAEYFSGVVQPGYQHALHTDYHESLFNARQLISYETYQAFYQFRYVEDGSQQIIPAYLTGQTRLAKLDQHKRIYVHHEKMNSHQSQSAIPAEKENISSRSRKTFDHGNPIDETREKNETREIWAPGKLILSGEHAVVYGCPVLAMAINRYTKVTVTREAKPEIKFDLSDLAHCSRLSFQALKYLKDKIKRKYYRFICGDFSIREVLQKPFELAQVALGIFTEALNLPLPHGVKIHVQSDIPIGCGMGSSAATILSVMQSVSSYLRLPLSEEKLLQLALEAENMQHGHSSGVDLRIALKGGCLYIHGEHSEPRMHPELPMYLINTGTPQTSTGQCIEKVAPLFSSELLRNEFSAITNAMDAALQQASWQTMQDTIRHNHQLLTNIGVVPKKVQQFITQVEVFGGAAKICGAGAVTGDQAGAMLVVLQDKKILNMLCDRFTYPVIPISGDVRGMHAA